MQAAVLHDIGRPPAYADFAEPRPGPDEVVLHMRAASLKPIDHMLASGSHYATMTPPAVCGIDGVGVDDDGRRWYAGSPRAPFGMMAERAAVPWARCVAVPDDIDDLTAAALPNPGMSALLALSWRGRLAPGDDLLVLGATGIAGTLAVQLARRLGARRVVAAGRDLAALAHLRTLGADTTVALTGDPAEVTTALADAAGADGFSVVVDYLWGKPVEALFAALGRHDLSRTSSATTRIVQAGQSAGPDASLPAALLRSSTVEIQGCGTGNFPPPETFARYLGQLFAQATDAPLHLPTEAVPLTAVADAWTRPTRRRIVLTL